MQNSFLLALLVGEVQLGSCVFPLFCVCLTTELAGNVICDSMRKRNIIYGIYGMKYRRMADDQNWLEITDGAFMHSMCKELKDEKKFLDQYKKETFTAV